MARDPRLAPTPHLDAEGEVRRYQPLIARGVIVGSLSSQATFQACGLSRSSGSLVDDGSEIRIACDALSVQPWLEGPTATAMIESARTGWLIEGALHPSPTGLVATAAKEIRDGVVAPDRFRVHLGGSAVLLTRSLSAVGSTAAQAAVTAAQGPPARVRCPALKFALR